MATDKLSFFQLKSSETQVKGEITLLNLVPVQTWSFALEKTTEFELDWG